MAADAPAADAIRSLDRLYRDGTALGLSEAQLLDRFLCSRDEPAFEALVARHGPMVLRTCRALLADPHDADDAFQATFLVLARRAGSIRDAELLGPWLHRVAGRVARRAGLASSRRRRRERPDTVALRHAPAPERLPHPDRAAIHQAIDRLPESYRLVLILCDLEGHTHAEAASRLGWPIGTVKGRQSRARALLRRRLSRLGLAPAAGPAGLLLAPPIDAAVVPPALISRTARAALAFAVGGTLAPGTVPAGALALATGVLTGMIAPKLTLVALAGLLSLGAIASGLAARPPDPSDDQDALHPPVSRAVPPPEDERVALMLGDWDLILRDGEPIPEHESFKLQLRPADPGLAAVFATEAVPLIATFVTRVRLEGQVVTSNSDWFALVDPDPDPGHFDLLTVQTLSSRDGPEGGRGGIRRPGIYRVDGDTLTIHYAWDLPRPSGFDRIPETTTSVFRKATRPPNGPGGVAGVDPPPSFEASGADFPAGVETATATPPDQNAQGIESLLGSWTLVSMNGVPAPDGKSRLDLAAQNGSWDGARVGISCTSTFGPLSLSPVGPNGTRISFAKGTMTQFAILDPAASPPTWDYVSMMPAGATVPNVRGSDKVVSRGIYRVEGDTLTIHRANQDAPRPSGFERTGPGSTLLVFRRIPDRPAGPATPTAAVLDSPPAHSPAGGGVAGVVPTPAVDAPGVKVPERGDPDPSRPDVGTTDAPGLPASAPADSGADDQLTAAATRREILEELDQKRSGLLAALAHVRADAESHAIEAEVLGDLYRKRLASYEELRLGRIGLDKEKRERAEAELRHLEDSVMVLKQEFVRRSLDSEEKQADLRRLESDLARIDHLMMETDSPAAPLTEALERRLDGIESKLERLIEQIRSGRLP